MKKLFSALLIVLFIGSCHAQKHLTKTAQGEVQFSCPACDTVVYKTTGSSRTMIEISIQTNLSPKKGQILDVLAQQGRYEFIEAGGLDVNSVSFVVDRKEIFLKDGKHEVQLVEKIKAVVYVPANKDIIVSK